GQRRFLAPGHKVRRTYWLLRVQLFIGLYKIGHFFRFGDTDASPGRERLERTSNHNVVLAHRHAEFVCVDAGSKEREVGIGLDVAQSQLFKHAFHNGKALLVLGAGEVLEAFILDGCQCSVLTENTQTAGFHRVDTLDQFRVRIAEANAQTGKTVDLGSSAGNNDVVHALCNQMHHAAEVGVVDVLVVSLIDKHQSVFGNGAYEVFQCLF